MPANEKKDAVYNRVMIPAIISEFPFLSQYIADPATINSLRVQRVDVDLMTRSTRGTSWKWVLTHANPDQYGAQTRRAYLLLDADGKLLWELGTCRRAVTETVRQRIGIPWLNRRTIFVSLRAEKYFQHLVGLTVSEALALLPETEGTTFILEAVREIREEPNLVLYRAPKQVTIKGFVDNLITAQQELIRTELAKMDSD